jgi:hypothetical protein
MTADPLRLAFVSAPGGSAFMAELLTVVADAVVTAGGTAICHTGSVEDVLDERTVAVVVPHEYVVLAGSISPEAARRTIGFGVEQPGTATFDATMAVCAALPAAVHVSADAVRAARRRGVPAERFVLGYSPIWDRRGDVSARDVDVTMMATADERRLGVLAESAADLSRLRCELLLPPHEPMTRPRPDFVLAADKWRLLARSRLLLNVHREGAVAFEWVRGLEAISNGCVVLTEPSSGLTPLVPGEHLLVATPARLGRVATAALTDPDLLVDIAGRALAVGQEELSMTASAARLLDVAHDVRRAAPVGVASPPVGRSWTDSDPPLAQWVPAVRPLPPPAAAEDIRAVAVLRDLAASGVAGRAETGPRPAVPGAAEIDVVCVERPGDGPLARTLASLSDPAVSAGRVALHIARDGAQDGARDGARYASVRTRLAFADPVGRGRARAALLNRADAPWVLIVDGGDELLGSTLTDLLDLVRAGADVDVVYPMAVLGSRLVVNAMVPELRRLDRFAYLGRGYLVRRAFLDDIGGFALDVELGGLVDHDFWLRSCAAGAKVTHLRRIGVRLWDQSGPMPDDVAPQSARAALRRRLAAVR